MAGAEGEDLGLAPVLVVHGAAVRDRDNFAAEVARLAAAVGVERRFVPVFWGDLARPAEAVERVLPYAAWSAGGRADAGDDAEAGGFLDDGQQMDDASQDAAVDAAVDEAFGAGDDSSAAERAFARVRRIWSERDLDAMVERFGENWRRQSGAARRRVLAGLYRAVRAQYLATAANFAGDVILYQRRQAEIHARVWETLMREAPGWGLAETPLSVVTHSLGGSVAFDLAVGGHPQLHIDQLVSCGCTAPYFHAIGCSPPSLAMYDTEQHAVLGPSIRSWTNFFVPLDPWGYIAEPVFRLHDGSAPVDVELHAGEREDKIMRHRASHYWRHPMVINHLQQTLQPTAEPG